MKSLFILSLPRSLSSLIYHEVANALYLRRPGWTTEGEILNVDRYIFNQNSLQDNGLKYIEKELRPLIFDKAYSFLDEVAKTENYIYKDVIHPFVTAAWLKDKDVKVLKIHRRVADVAFAMMSKRWFYPAQAGEQEADLMKAMVQGLLKAQQAIASVEGPWLDYEEIIYSEDSLRNTLVDLYPNRSVPYIHYINDQFSRYRDQCLKRRSTDTYKMIEALVDREQHEMPFEVRETVAL